MHGSTFTLATAGCAKKHCTQAEDDAVNLSTPAPGVDRWTLKPVHGEFGT
jgi:hypothetical protein